MFNATWSYTFAQENSLASARIVQLWLLTSQSARLTFEPIPVIRTNQADELETSPLSATPPDIELSISDLLILGN